jgi:hypothetical protein
MTLESVSVVVEWVESEWTRVLIVHGIHNVFECKMYGEETIGPTHEILN